MVGSTVHYVSYGTPGGEYTPQCRAAVVTSMNTGDVSLCVLNPEGLFFNQHVRHDGGELPVLTERTGLCGGLVFPGGTWHWPLT